MDKSSRERWLAVLLPAMLIAAGYVMFFNRDASLRTAREQLEATRQTAVAPEAVDLERLKLAKLSGEVDALKKAKKQLDVHKESLAAVGSSSPILRTQALRQLSSMLWDRGLYPFEESALEGESGVLSPSFDEVLKKLSGSATSQNSSARRLWRIRFYGRYADVLKTLETLRDSESPVIPVSLTMSETRTETEWRSWTLLLWI